MIGLSAVGAVAFAATLTHWLLRDERPWVRAFGVIPFICAGAAAGCVIALIYGIGSLIRGAW